MSSAELESYLLLAKQATGKALVSLIQQVLRSPTIFTFQEFLQCPNVTSLEGTEDQQWVHLLRLFALDNYRDYVTHQSQLPAIGEPEVQKLRQLSVITLASQSHILPYDILMKELDISGIRQLEDLIIEGIYKSLFNAKLDARKEIVYIQSTTGRDVANEALPGLVQNLQAWEDNCALVLKEVQTSIVNIKQNVSRKQAAEAEHARAVEEAKTQINLLHNRGKRNGQQDDIDQAMDDVQLDLSGSSIGNRKRKTASQARR